MPYRCPILWTRLAVVALVTCGRLLVADDQTTASANGEKTVNVGNMPIRVQGSNDPYAAVSSHDTASKYDPSRIFSRPSSMAGKSFSNSSNITDSGHNDYNTKSSDNTFVTKPYSFDAKTSSQPGFNTAASYPTTPLSNSSNTEFGKSFKTASADLGPNTDKAATFASSKSSDQDRTAVLGGKTTDTYASTFADKKFTGDEAQASQKRLTRLNNGQMYVQDLPNRPLTIDEVRDLINHGFKPDTDNKPAEDESKPLNDPTYVPKPIRESPDVTTPVATPVSDDDKDDPVPPPGTMSSTLTPPPENSQALPQK